MTVGEWLSERQRSEYDGGYRTYSSNNRNSCNTVVVHMSDYKWCHGPKCHKNKTQDRVRGSKGSKVLRTRKIKDNPHYNEYFTPFKYFCSQGCYTDFFKEHIERIIAIAPRYEPLETPIEDPVRERSEYGYINTTIKERVDTSME